jgi:hypothetical protein
MKIDGFDRCVFVVVAVLLFSDVAFSKCALLSFGLKGVVEFRHTGALTITVRSDVPAGWVNAPLEVKQHRFQGVFMFDTLSAFGGDEVEKCERKPLWLELDLIGGGTTNGLRLDFPKDFRRVNSGEYVSRRTIVLR